MPYSSHPVRLLLTVLCTTTVFGQLFPVQAQITPDGTLGNETSTVTSDALVQGATSDLIEGGAMRGSNLFHSFQEFNVGEGQRVYFANPDGIDSILSRVTGGDPSNIFGTLGVDGTADLFLLNPNGIVFGENAGVIFNACCMPVSLQEFLILSVTILGSLILLAVFFHLKAIYQ